MKTLVDFSHTSVLATTMVQTEMKNRILQHLGLYVENPQSFLEALTTHHGVISGPFALDILDPLQQYDVPYMDVLLGNAHFQSFVVYLKNEEKAHQLERRCELWEFLPGSYAYALMFSTRLGTIRLVKSVDHSAYHLVPTYIATHWMNYVTLTHLIIAYPQLTFERQAVKLSSTIPDWAVGSYVVRSRDRLLPGVDCHPSNGCGRCYRWFNDDFTVVLGFGNNVDVERNNHWRLGGVPCNRLCSAMDHVVADDPE